MNEGETNVEDERFKEILEADAEHTAALEAEIAEAVAAINSDTAKALKEPLAITVDAWASLDGGALDAEYEARNLHTDGAYGEGVNPSDAAKRYRVATFDAHNKG